MKKFIFLASVSGLLSACTTIPVPVNPGIVIPNFMPQHPATTYVPQADPFMAQANAAAAVAPQRTATATPVVISAPVTAIPASYSPGPIPDIAISANSPSATNRTITTLRPVTPVNTISKQQNGKLQNLSWLSGRILKNQTAGDPAKLISWNEKSNFVALGIGHLIWYPANQKGSYSESFPVFLDYAKAHGAQLPPWLANQYKEGAPWSNSATFARAKNDPQLRELHTFMNKTLNLQANFMVTRLKQTVPAMLQTLPSNERQRVHNNYLAVERSPGGIYPLLDYIQFKGSGINPAERYGGQGWGLLQVLQEMQTTQPGPAALADFRRAADDVLVRRIANAPATSHEARYLSQWLDRISSYNPGKSS